MPTASLADILEVPSGKSANLASMADVAEIVSPEPDIPAVEPLDTLVGGGRVSDLPKPRAPKLPPPPSRFGPVVDAAKQAVTSHAIGSLGGATASDVYELAGRSAKGLAENALGEPWEQTRRNLPGPAKAAEFLYGAGKAVPGLIDFAMTPAGAATVAAVPALPPPARAAAEAYFGTDMSRGAKESVERALQDPTAANIGEAAGSTAMAALPVLHAGATERGVRSRAEEIRRAQPEPPSVPRERAQFAVVTPPAIPSRTPPKMLLPQLLERKGQMQVEPMEPPTAGPEWWRQQGETRPEVEQRYAQLFDEAEQREATRARRAAQQPPEIPSVGPPEGVQRGMDSRQRLARQLAQKPWEDLSNSERVAIDDLIAEGYTGAGEIQVPEPPVKPAVAAPPAARAPRTAPLSDIAEQVVSEPAPTPKAEAPAKVTPTGVELPKAEFAKEHAELPEVLVNGTPAERAAEAAKQTEELREVEGAERPVAGAEKPQEAPIAEVVPTAVQAPERATGPAAAAPKEPWRMTQAEYVHDSGEWRAMNDEMAALQEREARLVWTKDKHGYPVEQKRLSPAEAEEYQNLRAQIRDLGARREAVLKPVSDRTMQHADEVENAVKAGLPVPPEVLADYPDLKGTVNAPTERTIPPPERTAAAGPAEPAGAPPAEVARAVAAGDEVGTEVAPASLGYVELRSDNPRVPAQRIPIKTADQASAVVRRYIDNHGLGSGSIEGNTFTGGDIRDASGSLVARVSYNGRVWGPDGKVLQEAAGMSEFPLDQARRDARERAEKAEPALPSTVVKDGEQWELRPGGQYVNFDTNRSEPVETVREWVKSGQAVQPSPHRARAAIEPSAIPPVAPLEPPAPARQAAAEIPGVEPLDRPIEPKPVAQSAEFQRTTPAKGTPEREQLEADYTAADEARSAWWEKERTLKEEINKAGYGTKRRTALEAKLEKAQAAYNKSGNSERAESLGQASYEASLEDAALQTENPVLRLTAKLKQAERAEELRRKTTGYSQKTAEAYQQQYKETGDKVVALLEKMVPEIDAKDTHASTKRLAELLTPEEQARAIDSAVKDAAQGFLQHPLSADDVPRRLGGSLYGARNRILGNRTTEELSAIKKRYNEITDGGANRAFERESRVIENAYGPEETRKALEEAREKLKQAEDARVFADKDKADAKILLSQRTRPLAELEAPAMNESAGVKDTKVWDGNAVDGGTLLSDGHSIIDSTVVKDKKRVASLGRMGNHITHYPEKGIRERLWDKTIKLATKPLKEVGYVNSSGYETAVFSLKDGTPIALSAKRTRFIQALTGATEIRGSTESANAVVFYRDGKPVAVLSRLKGVPDIDVDVARKAASGPASDTAQPAPSPSERGSVPASVLTAPVAVPAKAVAELVKQDVAPGMKNAAVALARAWDALKKVSNPASRGPEAKTTALSMREHMADRQRAYDIAERAMAPAHKAFAKVSGSAEQGDATARQTVVDFIDGIERGEAQSDATMNSAADIFRSILDQRRDAVRDVDPNALQHYIENYFPHIWKDPAAAKTVMEQIFQDYMGKRPMEGNRSWMKMRTIPFFKEGIARGLEPVSWNPVDLVTARIVQMDKYIMAHRVFGDMKDSGLLKFVRSSEKAPEGYAPINDNIATVYGPRQGAVKLNPEKIEPKPESGDYGSREEFDRAMADWKFTQMQPEDVTVYGQRIMGHYYAPEPAARVINNHLSPGLRGSELVGPMYRAWIGASNWMNQFQLGFSLFHAGFTSVDAITSKVALGLVQASHGDIGKAAKSFAAAPASWIQQPFGIGHKLVKEWAEPGSQGEAIGVLVDAMKSGGWRANMDRFYKTRITHKMIQAWRAGNPLGAAWRAPFAVVEQSVRPVLEWFVPRQKAAVVADLIRYEMERNPNMTHAQLREVAAKAVDSADNRMGQLAYDNLFWDKTLKDLAMATTRSVGWNLGTFRELGGGALDLRKLASTKPELTYRASYIPALVMTTGTIGAVMGYLMTGQGPQELKDYFFPKTGNTDEHGNPERVSLPSYMKDIYHYATEPGKTITNKMHPMLNTAADMLQNKDYYGTEIRNENDPIMQQLKDLGTFAIKQYMPFSARGAQKEASRGAGFGKIVLPFFGVTPAPASMNQTPAEALIREYQQANRPQGSKTKREAERTQARSAILRAMRKGDSKPPELSAAISAGYITRKDVPALRKSARLTPIQAGIQSLSAEEAVNVYEKATPAERASIRRPVEKKLRALAPRPAMWSPALIEKSRRLFNVRPYRIPE